MKTKTKIKGEGDKNKWSENNILMKETKTKGRVTKGVPSKIPTKSRQAKIPTTLKIPTGTKS